MGNNHSSSIVTRNAGALDTFISELGPDVIYDKSLGNSRFLKTVRCRHRNGYLVAKIYIKPEDDELDEKYIRRLRKEKKVLQDVPNVYTYRLMRESLKAGYLVRQWVASSLYDRISTRPFLSAVEKKWIAFQILVGLRDARKRKVAHGDIKSENILVTSWNWIYITDFASFKPTFLPLDNPSDFAYFYDTSGRRSCYVAPERFYTNEKAADNVVQGTSAYTPSLPRSEASSRDGKVTEAMDVFSAGCVLAELFLEGTVLFTLSQLFKYRNGEYDPNASLVSIEDESIRTTIKQMIALDPSERPTFDGILHNSRDTLFPDCFYSTFHDFISSVNDISASSPFSNVMDTSSKLPIQIGPNARTDEDRANISEAAHADTPHLPTDSDQRISRIWSDFDILEPHFALEQDETLEGTSVKIDYAANYSAFKPIQSVIPVMTHMANGQSRVVNNSTTPLSDGPALIILSLVCSNIRNCRLPSSKLRALDMLLSLSAYLTDEAKVDRLLPYVMDLLSDDAPIVRATALRTALQTLAIVKKITPFNANILPQYVLPQLRYLAVDAEVSVRSTLAQCIVTFASLSTKYLDMGVALRGKTNTNIPGANLSGDGQIEVSYDLQLEELQNIIEDYLSSLLVDQSSVVKRSMLLDLAPLCIFLGREKTNDVLLSHMITYLNDRDWLLRYAFFDSVVDVAACLGGRNLEEYIFPLLTQALSDAQESNVAKVLSSLTSLSELGLFQKLRVWELMSSTLPLLYHPNSWIRQGSCLFIASAAKALPITDVWCILYPSLKHFLRSEIRVVDVGSIMRALKSPLPRHIYDFSMDWAMKMGNSQFWKTQRKTSIRNENLKEAAMGAARRSTRGSIRITMKSEEDELQLGKLEQLGMTAPEEAKLIALRDYIAKSADAVNSLRSRSKSDNEQQLLQTTGHVELQKLGVVPETIFLGSRTSSFDNSQRTGEKSESQQTPSHDQTSGAPLEDLRRRLTAMNGSNASFGSLVSRDRGALPPTSYRSSTMVSTDATQPGPPRPGSPTESITSATNSVSMRPRFSIGSFDGMKVAPAIGSIRTNAIGLLEAPGRTAGEGELDRLRSGVTSPVSFSHNVRGGIHTPGSFSAAQEGQDQPLNTFLDQMYNDMNKEAQHDFGPKVHEGPIRRRNAGRSTFSLRDPKRRHLEATLITHLNSHTDLVNGLAVSPDHVFFVSCSDDKTLKVWDSSRLERNVTTKPRFTYSQHHARVKCICMLEGYHAFASAAEDGSLHILRVHVNLSSSLPKYTKLQVIREHRVERPGEYILCMFHYNTDTTSNLIYATNHSSISVLDLRTMRILQLMENPKHLGPIVSLCVDRKRTWMVTGGLTGSLALWDLRFGLLLRTWKVGPPGATVRVRQCILHPSKGRGRWIIVALEVQDGLPPSRRRDIPLMEIWDVEKVSLVGTLVCRDTSIALGTEDNDGTSSTPSPSPSPSPNPMGTTTQGRPAEPTPAAAIAALVRARQNASHSLDSDFTLSPQIKLKRDASTSSTDPFASPGLGPAFLETLSRASPLVGALTAGIDFGGHASAPRSFVDLSLDAERQALNSAAATSTSAGSGGGNLDVGGEKQGGGRGAGLRAGFLLVGGEDCSVKLLDLERFERSTVLSRREEGEEKSAFSTLTPLEDGPTTYMEILTRTTGSGGGGGTHPSTVTGGPSSSSNAHANSSSSSNTNASQRPAPVAAEHQASLLRAHQDCIRAIACIDAPFRGGFISADRSGVIKVWRVEGLAEFTGGLYG